MFLAYHRDARREASGVWHFGTQSESFGAGTAGLGNPQSVLGSRQCCRVDTRSLLPGSPGHHWRDFGKETVEQQKSGSDTYREGLFFETKNKKRNPAVKWMLNC